MRLIMGDTIWEYGTVATVVLVALKFFDVIEWSWWITVLPLAFLGSWMLVYQLFSRLPLLAALGGAWLVVTASLKLIDVITWSWWAIFLPFIVLTLLAGAILRRKLG